MAGGIFKAGVSEIRPGVYINMKSGRQVVYAGNNSGVVVLPLIGHTYGPKGFIEISCVDPSASKPLLGYDVEDNAGAMLFVREALKNAFTVFAYNLCEGTKATATVSGVTVTAKYGGTRGNDLKVVFKANVADQTAFDCYVYLENSLVEKFTAVKTIDDLKAEKSEYIDFSGEGDIASENAGTNLAGGTNGTSKNEDFTEFLDECEQIVFDTIAFPISDTSLKTAAITKIKYLNDDMGKYVIGVVANQAADNYNVINVTNGVFLEDGTEVSAIAATAYVAGARAKAGYKNSLTGAEYDGAVSIINKKSHEEAKISLKNGEFFFTFDDTGAVCCESDINSLVTISEDMDKTYRKNKVIAIAYAIFRSIKAQFKESEYANTENGWSQMQGAGAAVLVQYQNDNVIESVDTTNDFVIDKAKSSGDETYVTIGFKPVDSAEKIYITAITR